MRGLSTAPNLLMEIVRATDPDMVEAHFANFRLTNVDYDLRLIRGDLTVEDFTAKLFSTFFKLLIYIDNKEIFDSLFVKDMVKLTNLMYHKIISKKSA